MSGIKAVTFNSTQDFEEKCDSLHGIYTSSTKIFFISPECLINERILTFLRKTKVCLFCVDEVHCALEWGQFFRPGHYFYLHICSKLNKIYS